jgi:hypothetical protein
MKRTTRISHLAMPALLAVALVAANFSVAQAGLIVLVDETFNGYTEFPDEKPKNDPVNLGVPTVAKGANSPLWLAARFEYFDDDPLRKDVGVQRFGSLNNLTPVGRAGDDAGLVLRLDLTDLVDVTLDFDWRTFSADSRDKFVVAYYQGDGTEFQPEGLGDPNGYYDWYNDPELGGGVMDLDDGAANSWYEENWVELLRASPRDTFKHQQYVLPSGSVLYLAFWLDNGDGDFAKIDNILIMANPREIPIPEPSTWALALLGALGLCAAARRRRGNRS